MSAESIQPSVDRDDAASGRACEGTLLVLDDDREMCRSQARTLSREGYQVLVGHSGREGLELLRDPANEVDVALCDLRMDDVDGMEFIEVARSLHPDLEIIMMSGYGTIQTAVEAVRKGAYDFLPKPFKRVQLLKVIARAMERRALVAENRRLRAQIADGGGRTVIGDSPGMRAIMEMAVQVAPSEATVLILGESGTGKEVIARTIHDASDRARMPFIKTSCAALPESLLEAELFGYEKGAFTGAMRRKPGRFELADGGTIFLDEIGDVPLEMQVKLLRVLQEREFERIGGTRTLKVDVRVVAATHRNLKQLIERDLFREDLYYRLAVIPIEIPPLRERREDVPLLATYFVERLSAKNHHGVPRIAPEAMDSLARYSWPGNVRELENAMERAVVLCKGELIRPIDLPPHISPRHHEHSYLKVPLGSTLREVEDSLIDQCLRITNGDRQKAAHLLGISPRTIYRRLKAREGE